jgi:hypothetical protein
MFFTTQSAAAVVALVVGLAAAQSDNNNVPSCAQDCISQYTSGGSQIGNCTGLDVACICRNSTFVQQVSCCVDDSCDDSNDRTSAIDYARGICSAAGVQISDSDVGCNANSGGNATTSTVTTTGTTSNATSTGTYTSTRRRRRRHGDAVRGW